MRVGRTKPVPVRGRRARWRRGVVGILAMMFLVMFASLAAAMAVATQGNMRSAASHLRVVRSLGAVDTGMRLARSRLEDAAGRFLVSEGEVTPDYLETLWFGPIPSDPPVTVTDPPFGISEGSAPGSIQAALANLHAADAAANLVDSGEVDNAPLGITVLDRGDEWLVTLPVGVARNADGEIVSAAQVSYSPPDDDGAVTVVVTGYDWDPVRERWVTRVAQERFRLTKRIEYALLSNTPPLIGVGGNVEGPVGTRFVSASLDTIDGDPIRVLSDFYGLDAGLDAKLDDLYASVLQFDTDGDNRLNVNHVFESVGVGGLNDQDYDGDDDPDNAFADVTGDDAVDDFDVFIRHFDTNGDNSLTLSASLTDGTPADGQTAEFTANDRLALLLDSVDADRNDNGVFNGRLVEGEWDYDTFEDNNEDGALDAGDIDADDVVLGYRDGRVDYRDRYAKVRGSVMIAATRAQWESSTGVDGSVVNDFQRSVQGPVRPDEGDGAVVFEAEGADLPEITDESFAAATATLVALAEGAGDGSFEDQVEDQMGAGWTPTTRIEPTPFGAASAGDWFERPVYEGLTFRNVTIPMGTNALFIDCEFIGITRVEVYTDNSHPSWPFYGEQERDPITGALSPVYPPPPASSETALDKSYADALSPGYDALPDPLDVPVDLDGDTVIPDRCYDTKQLCNNIRFHNCLFVGSVVADKPDVYTHLRNKMQFTGSTRFALRHPVAPDDPGLNPDPDHEAEIRKSSLMAPHFSVDIGSINPPPEQDVRLQGAIVAGVLDVRGDAEIRGVLLSTFEPVRGEAPLVLYGAPVGNPAAFNMTIGYVTTDDGDEEAVDPTDLSDIDGDDQLDLGWDSARADDGSLVTVAGWDGTHEDRWYDGVPDDDATPGVHVRVLIPWHGMGVTRVIADPEAVLPDGLSLPLSVRSVANSYREGF